MGTLNRKKGANIKEIILNTQLLKNSQNTQQILKFDGRVKKSFEACNVCTGTSFLKVIQLRWREISNEDELKFS
jgi:hypothetical protein